MTKQPKTDGSDSLFTSVVAVVRELGSADEHVDWLNEKSAQELEDERKQRNHLMPALKVVDGTKIADTARAKIEVMKNTFSGSADRKK